MESGVVSVTALALVWVVGPVLAVLWLYANVLASIGILRDHELSRSMRLLRLVFVWCVPLLGAVLSLRVSSEESPYLLPSRRWLWPFLTLLSDRPESFSGNEVIDVAGESARSLPGQVGNLNAGAFNVAAGDSSAPSGDHGGSE
jgi:hypothetical protein